MPTFAFEARTADGERISGTLAGASEQSIVTELQARRLSPIRVRALREERGLRRRVSPRQLASAYRQLADLLRAGVPLLRGLRLLGRGKANPRPARVMAQIAESVADGGPLAEAMQGHPDVFPSVHVAMVRAGERGGFLESVLQRMAIFVEHQADLRGKVVGNLVYPVALLAVGLGVVVFALVSLVPKFEGFYARIELPMPTRLLLGTSALLVERWPVLLAVLVAAGIGLWWLAGQPEWRRRLAALQLATPTLGPLVRDLAVGRFVRVLGTLLENGIPLLSAMEISREASGHVLLEAAIAQASDSVRAGETLAAPLAASGMLAEDMVEMIQVGESANNLPEVLVTMADTIEKRADRMLTAFVRLLEPLLLLLMAGMVLFIFVALVVPMLRMSSSM